MGKQRPALTWGWLKSWAGQNGVTDQHLLIDDYGARVNGAYYQDAHHGNTVYLRISHTGREATWEAVKAVPAPDDAEVWFSGNMGADATKVLDLGTDAGDTEGRQYFILQHRWG